MPFRTRREQAKLEGQLSKAAYVSLMVGTFGSLTGTYWKVVSSIVCIQGQLHQLSCSVIKWMVGAQVGAPSRYQDPIDSLEPAQS